MNCEYLFFQGIAAAPARKEPERTPVPEKVDRRVPSEEPADDFLREVFAGAGLALEAYRSRALSRRLAACLRFLRVPDVAGARKRLSERPELVDSMLDLVLLGVTEFGRDPEVFAQIREEILPMWARLHRPLRVWSAACSDGRELLSVGILLAEEGLLDQAELLGTDCRATAIATAQLGRYPAASLGHLQDSWRNCFARQRELAVAPDALRRALRWRQANLLRGPEPGPWDLILWRNMAIYLEPESAGKVWPALVRELAPGGCLVTGKAEAPPRELPLERVGPCLYRKPFLS